MKWTEGLRRIWVIWCWVVGGLTLMATALGLALESNSYGFQETLGGVIIMASMGAFLAYLPRFPWLLIDLVKWIGDGFREPPSK
jgi:hypothetical protein